MALRRLGVEAAFACAPGSGASINKVAETARDRGIEPILAFRLNKHHNPIFNVLDGVALRRYLRNHPCDLVHCHLDNDHRIAASAARSLGMVPADIICSSRIPWSLNERCPAPMISIHRANPRPASKNSERVGSLPSGP